MVTAMILLQNDTPLFKSVQNADGDYVPNVKDMSKGLPERMPRLLKILYEGIDTSSQRSKLRKDKVTTEIFKEQNIDVATLKASNDEIGLF